MEGDTYLYLTPFYPDATDWRGGFCSDFVAALRRVTELEVVVMVPGRDFAFRQLPCGLAPFWLESANNRSFRQALAAWGIDPERIAVVHANTLKTAPFAAELKRLNPKATAVLHHHALNSVRETSGRLGRVPVHAALLRRYNRRLCAAMDVHVFVSEAVRRAYPFELREGQRGMVCYNGIAPEFRPMPEVRARREQEVFTVGCVANFDPLKDQMTLLKAMEKLEAEGGRWKTVFVGSGPELARCRRYAEQRGINAEFRTEMPHAEMPRFYNEIDLMALPSLSEGFCCACTEAWACGTPFVGCDGVPLGELMSAEDREKWLAKPRDFADLAKKIARARREGGRQELTKDLSIDEVVGQLLAIVQNRQ